MSDSSLVNADHQGIVSDAGNLFTLLERTIDPYLAGLTQNTRRAYGLRVRRFVEWGHEQPRLGVLAIYLDYYNDEMNAQGLSPRSRQAYINTI